MERITSEVSGLLKGRLKVYFFLFIIVVSFVAAYAAGHLKGSYVILLFIPLVSMVIFAFLIWKSSLKIRRERANILAELDRWLGDSSCDLPILTTTGPIRNFLFILKGRLLEHFKGDVKREIEIDNIYKECKNMGVKYEAPLLHAKHLFDSSVDLSQVKLFQLPSNSSDDENGRGLF